MADMRQVGSIMVADWEKKAGVDGAALIADFRKK
jgi:TRAP-type transport system periplasmic protein